MDHILLGDCLETMKTLADNSVDTIVTDPPYGLSFMGKKWDYDVPSVDIWRECLRVLKPGGYLLSFAGTRTQHRMACNIEDAGFEIRDMIAWVYGSGFPKSLNIGKAVDKLQGNEREVIGKDKAGTGLGLMDKSSTIGGEFALTKLSSEWEGWGTALKPAFEPITIARKPISEKTVAENCLKWGVGGIDIDGSRVEADNNYLNGDFNPEKKMNRDVYNWSNGVKDVRRPPNKQGRFPANLIHDGSDEVVSLFPNSKSGARSSKHVIGNEQGEMFNHGIYGKYKSKPFDDVPATEGSASRFFYCAKAPKDQRFSYLTCNCQTVKLDSWQKQDQNQKDQTETTLPEVDTYEESMEDDSDLNMTSYGNEQTDQSPRDTTSTILTGTSSTTNSPTSSSLPPQNTNESMVDVNCEAVSGGSLAQSVNNSNQSIPNTGTSQEKGGLCTGVVVSATLAESYRKSVCVDCRSEVKISGHPTQKPLALMEYLVKLVSRKGAVVLDPFAGSGSTLIACKKTGRNYIGCEMNEEYVKIAEARLKAVSPDQIQLL